MPDPLPLPNRSLEDEKADLVKADQDIADGERRVTEQVARIEKLRADGHDTSRAEGMLLTLKAALAEWYAHRAEILGRIDRLQNF
ncbi:hypothetical protein [Methylobacterium nigriterrae]|uniref:hypothetical protein n=1 Tax=Methylobacterium nigriterrae TaxID=3127512 RepID=UPI00301415EB